MKRTPGNWTVSKPLGPGNIGIHSKRVNAGGNFYIAELPNCPHDEAEGNAALLAAAPELFDALQTLMWWANDEKKCQKGWGGLEHTRVINAAKDAISKAKGY